MITRVRPAGKKPLLKFIISCIPDLGCFAMMRFCRSLNQNVKFSHQLLHMLCKILDTFTHKLR